MALEIHRATRGFPRDETYGLAHQLRRAAVSVPSNIAEGQGRYSRREFHRFLNNARGSLSEIETQILLARELVYLPQKDADGLLIMKAAELGRILNGLIASTRKEVVKG